MNLIISLSIQVLTLLFTSVIYATHALEDPFRSSLFTLQLFFTLSFHSFFTSLPLHPHPRLGSFIKFLFPSQHESVKAGQSLQFCITCHSSASRVPFIEIGDTDFQVQGLQPAQKNILSPEGTTKLIVRGNQVQVLCPRILSSPVLVSVPPPLSFPVSFL